MNLPNRGRENWIPVGLSLLCFSYYMAFLLRFGEMFFWGSDLLANAAYAMTMFTEVHRAGWTVPKASHMLLFGAVYWITRDVWFFHLVLIVAAALTVWAGCRLILKDNDNPIGCLAFCIFMMTLQQMFVTTLAGGPGCINLLFLLLAVVCVTRIDLKKHRILAIVFMCLANLTRPDSWPSTYLIILAVVTLRFFDSKEPKLSRSDLWFLIPMGMPLVWILLDWTVFGDPLYSMNIAKTFGRELTSGLHPRTGLEEYHQRSMVAAFFPKVMTTFSYLFSLSSWLSVRAGVLVILFVAGIGTMFRKQPRILLFVACPLLGTMLFYFVYALRGTVFRHDYIHTAFVCVILVVSVGLGSLCSLARHVRPRPFGRFLQVGLASLVLLFLTVGPVQRKIVEDTIPVFKRRAADARRADSAVESLVADVKGTVGKPLILTTKWVSGSRISLQLPREKELFLVERLVAKQRRGDKDILPDLEGRTVYYCFRTTMPAYVIQFLQPLIMQSKWREEIHNQDGLVVLKCSY